jgi:hypothetical protein
MLVFKLNILTNNLDFNVPEHYFSFRNFTEQQDGSVIWCLAPVLFCQVKAIPLDCPELKTAWVEGERVIKISVTLLFFVYSIR